MEISEITNINPILDLLHSENEDDFKLAVAICEEHNIEITSKDLREYTRTHGGIFSQKIFLCFYVRAEDGYKCHIKNLTRSVSSLYGKDPWKENEKLIK